MEIFVTHEARRIAGADQAALHIALEEALEEAHRSVLVVVEGGHILVGEL